MTADLCPACKRSRKLTEACPGFDELAGLELCAQCGLYARAGAVLSVMTEVPLPGAAWLTELAGRMADMDTEGASAMWDELEELRQ